MTLPMNGSQLWWERILQRDIRWAFWQECSTTSIRQYYSTDETNVLDDYKFKEIRANGL